MNFYTQLDLVRFFGLFTAGSLVGWMLGSFWLGFSIAAICWIVMQHREYTTFRRWALRPLRRPEFDSDAWQSAADTFFRAGRRQRERLHLALGSLRRMRAVTDALPDAAIVLDRMGCIVHFNPAAEQQLRIRRKDHGIPVVELIRHPQIVSMMKGGPDRDPVEFSLPNAESVRLEARLVSMGDAGTLLILRDVTERNRLLSMRQDFVANVSHELRTPLTVILGYLETLQDETLEVETTRELIDRIVPPARRMHALLDDLLILTRLESRDDVGLQGNAPIAMDALIRRVMSQTLGVKATHSVKVNVTSEQRLIGVPAEIESALGNLLSNAIRYSPDGGEISIGWHDDPIGTRLEVSDHGIGIAREHLSRLTERFYRVDLARARVQGGTGLGLAIVKHVLKRHGTALQVESEPGKGSRFFCVFPQTQLVPAERRLEVVGGTP